MPPPSRGNWKAGALAPSVKPDLAAAGVPVVCDGAFSAAGLAALTGVVLDFSGAFGPVDFNAFEGAFCDAFRVALAAFVAGFLADSLALAGAALARCGFADFADCAREAALRGDAFGGFLGDFLRVFLDIRLPFVAFGGSIMGLLRVMSSKAGAGSFGWANLVTAGYGGRKFDVISVGSLNDVLGPDDE